MNKNTLKVIALVVTIFLVGLFLRVYRLNLNMPPLYADETGQYFVYYTILNKSVTAIRYVINSTFTLTWLLGLSPLGVRLPSAIYSSALIVLAYFLGMRISNGNTKVSLVFSALIAVMPWDFMISRIGHTHIPIMLFFVCLHVYLYLKAQKIKDYLISLIPLVLGIIYYPTVIFVTPFISIHLIFTVFSNLSQKARWLFLLTFLVSVVALIASMSVHFKFFSTAGRGLDLAIWRDVNTPWEIDKYRALTWNSAPTLFSFGLPPEQLANKLVYNRVMANVSTFSRNYFSFYTPNCLLLKGAAILRHSTSQVGAFYPYLIPFMLFGAFNFFQTASKKNKIVILTWVLASPIPAAITKDGAGYLLRVVTMLPFLTYFCALGITESFNLVKRNWRVPYGLLVGAIALYSAYYFFFGYFHVYPALSARSYEYGFKELADFQVANNNAPLLIIWDGYYHNNDFRFWQATPFEEYKSFKLKEIVVGESHFNQTFPNLYFVNPKSAKDVKDFLKQTKIGFVVLPDRFFVNYPQELDKLYATPSSVIKYPDQTSALSIFPVK